MGLKTRAGMPNFAIGALYRGTGGYLETNCYYERIGDMPNSTDVRLWLLTDSLPHPELCPLCPRKRTFGGELTLLALSGCVRF